MSVELRPCPFCNGSGKVLDGYVAICTEFVEKAKKCPECKGNGLLSTDDTSHE